MAFSRPPKRRRNLARTRRSSTGSSKRSPRPSGCGKHRLRPIATAWSNNLREMPPLRSTPSKIRRCKGGISRKLFDQAVAIGRKRCLPQPLGLGERLLDPVLDRLVRAKLRRRFGGRLKAMVSGGAPLNPEIGSFFVALGVRLLQGYGQTEAAPVIACNSPARIKIDTVGPPLDGVRVKTADDGEILVAGDNVMQGYWNDPEATAQVLEDGWLKTGDVGFVDDDGYIRITDRKRDFIKTSAGETISPARVEGYLTIEPEIAQAMVFGDRRPYLVAVVVPDPDFAAAYGAGGPVGDFPAIAA